ncbi:hypothetical protein [Hymenobacter elongatus]|uniref:Uncharacterized protein n=1 Tax=Hymenobacter elongatus TaxID=877208 RepID=A0A4Z0PLQ3_9BACT|nr:hypothetical protein [Hymenobacter elongatus]TGE14994.1 hypothetical protein E5J99_13885 [Hymenobacter elongatus]
MAKIQRLKISTDEKMSMLRGQPGHMPAAPAVAEPIAPAPTTVSAPEPAPQPTPLPPAPAVVPVQTVAAAPVSAPRQPAPVAPATKKGRGRPPKAQAPAPVEGTSAGLQPSLIRLEGETQRAALAYIHEELMHHSRRVYLKELVDEAVNYYLQHGPPSNAK